MAMSRSFGATSLTTRSPMDSVPAVIVLQSGDHAQQGGLAAARRADQHHQLAVGDLEAGAVHGHLAVVVNLANAVELDAGHHVSGDWCCLSPALPVTRDAWVASGPIVRSRFAAGCLRYSAM